MKSLLPSKVRPDPDVSGVLLDTHALLWLYEPSPMSVESLLAVDLAAKSNLLFVSPISAWELGAASRKKSPAMRPQLRGLQPENWFVQATTALGVTAAPITQEIGLAACALPRDYGHADPGDCMLIATAHVLGLTLITRDQRILEFSRRNPAYLKALAC